MTATILHFPSNKTQPITEDVWARVAKMKMRALAIFGESSVCFEAGNFSLNQRSWLFVPGVTRVGACHWRAGSELSGSEILAKGSFIVEPVEDSPDGLERWTLEITGFRRQAFTFRFDVVKQQTRRRSFCFYQRSRCCRRTGRNQYLVSPESGAMCDDCFELKYGIASCFHPAHAYFYFDVPALHRLSRWQR